MTTSARTPLRSRRLALANAVGASTGIPALPVVAAAALEEIVRGVLGSLLGGGSRRR